MSYARGETCWKSRNMTDAQSSSHHMKGIHMTGDEFLALAETIWGKHWRHPCARTYDVRQGTAVAWSRGEYRIPDPVAEDITHLASRARMLRALQQEEAWSVNVLDGFEVAIVAGVLVATRSPGVSTDDHLGGWRLGISPGRLDAMADAEREEHDTI